MSDHKTLEEVAAMLDLPTAEDVADLLRTHGVKAMPFDTSSWCRSCPIAVFAHRLSGRIVYVGNYFLRDLDDGGRLAEIPRSAREFIHRVDYQDPAFVDLVVVS